VSLQDGETKGEKTETRPAEDESVLAVMSVVLPQDSTSRFNNWTRVRAILETIGQSINHPF
jgi:hypothetical protein